MAAPRRHLIFDADDPLQTVSALHGLYGMTAIGSLGEALTDALSGSAEATRTYVQTCRALTGDLLAEGHKAFPELVIVSSVSVSPRDVADTPTPFLVDVLANSCAEAPFTAWTVTLPLVDAVLVHLTNRCRALLGCPILVEPDEAPHVSDDIAAQRFLRRVRFHLNHPDTMHPLRRIMEAFDLSKTDTARLFGVSRQAIDHWLANDVPAERTEKVTALLSLLDILQRKLKADRLPGIARRHADAYGGATMLDLIVADRHDELLDITRRSFDWHQAA
jgi:hypothetical protein